MRNTQEEKPAQLHKLPCEVDRLAILEELTAAHAAVAELRGILTVLPDPDILIAPFRKREAVASSAIEGTTATLEDVLKFEASDKKGDSIHKEGQNSVEHEKERRRFEGVIEIMNYEEAVALAMEKLKERPIGTNLLKSVHSVLLDSVRGADKDRGNFRRKLVRVGSYIPPVHTEIPDLMSNWEKYLNTNDMEKDYLVRIGVAHYQFEAIHPFQDGNGRLGRLVIPLFLCQVGLLPTPVLYISHYLEIEEEEYRRLLHRVDTHQDWTAWLKFFLRAVKEQAEMTAGLGKEIQAVYEKNKKESIPKIKSTHAIAVLDLLFKQPIISARNVKAVIGSKSNNTPYSLLEKFVAAGVLESSSSSTPREKIYVFKELLDLLRS